MADRNTRTRVDIRSLQLKQPPGEIKLDARTVCELFGDEIGEWLQKKQQESTSQQPGRRYWQLLENQNDV